MVRLAGIEPTTPWFVTRCASEAIGWWQGTAASGACRERCLGCRANAQRRCPAFLGRLQMRQVQRGCRQPALDRQLIFLNRSSAPDPEESVADSLPSDSSSEKAAAQRAMPPPSVLKLRTFRRLSRTRVIRVRPLVAAVYPHEPWPRGNSTKVDPLVTPEIALQRPRVASD